MSSARGMLAVLVGGMLGTGLRLGFDLLLPHEPSSFPFSTLLVNIVGSFALGLLVSRLWGHAAQWLKAGLGTGLIGSFTTFSALMVSLTVQAEQGLWPLAVWYLAASLILGFGAAVLGLLLGHRFGSRSPVDWVDE